MLRTTAQPPLLESAAVLCQVFGARVRVDAVSKVAELELAEKEKMKAKVEKILKHSINVFINRFFDCSELRLVQ